MANSEYRLTVVVAKLGERETAEENMECFVDAFDVSHAEAGAVMAVNYGLEALDATFSVDAEDAKTASEVGLRMFCEAADASGIPPTEILEIRTVLVAPANHDQQLTGDLVPA